MKPLDFPLLSDENIAPDVVAGLRARGCDLRTAWDEQLLVDRTSMFSNAQPVRDVSSSPTTWPSAVRHPHRNVICRDHLPASGTHLRGVRARSD